MKIFETVLIRFVFGLIIWLNLATYFRVIDTQNRIKEIQADSNFAGLITALYNYNGDTGYDAMHGTK